MKQSSGKVTRRHSRQKSSRSTDAKGERFFLQGNYRFGNLAHVFSGPRESHPPTTSGLHWQDAFKLLNRLSEAYPSVPWDWQKIQWQPHGNRHGCLDCTFPAFRSEHHVTSPIL